MMGEIFLYTEKKGEGEVFMEQRIEQLLSQLTLEEKLDMIHGAGLFRTEGVERLGIPAFYFSDGPHGVRAEFHNSKWIPAGHGDDSVSYLPCNSALASTWNRELAYASGSVLGEEARGRGKDMILAPGINIKRSPLCGRNFEYLTEDPYLAGEMAVSIIRGIQQHDVSACVKHFAVNSQETDRLMVDTLVDERTLREIYLPAFKKALQEGKSYSIMGAYNKLNGEHCCENPTLLEEILRKEWGFDGTVVSDWAAVHRTKEASEVSLDVEMSVTDDFDNYYLANPLKEMIRKGEISEKCVDNKIRNILRMMYRLKMLGEEKELRSAGAYNTPEHRQAMLATARESVILLKNEDKKLPLNAKKIKKLAVIGQNAQVLHAYGGGSSEIKALYEINPLMGIKMLLGGNTKVCYAPGYAIPTKEQESEVNWQQDSVNMETMAAIHAPVVMHDFTDTEEGKRLLQEAITLAEECDEVIFVGGLNHEYDVEGNDRGSMKLPYGQDKVIEALLQVRPDMIVVMVAGSSVEMPWKAQTPAIVWSYYAGMETGTALAEVLFGKTNPSGKLAETFPYTYGDTPTGKNGEFAKVGSVEHKEGVFVGYRYYESKEVDVSYCFGHGLSYTEFVLSDFAQKKEIDGTIILSFTVKNIGDCAGAEVVQVYIGPATYQEEHPVKELKNFTKIFLESGESKRVEMCLAADDFAHYDVEKKAFVTTPGEYKIMIGTSVKNIQWEGTWSNES